MGSQWSVSLWFRQIAESPGKNLDFLIFMGRLDGQGGGGPELNVMLSGDSLLVRNYITMSRVTDLSTDVSGVTPKQWHHLVLTFNGSSPASRQPGTLSIYLDGQKIAGKENALLAPVLLSKSAPLIFGSINRPYQSMMRNRAINGVLADIRVYDRVLGGDEVNGLWMEIADQIGRGETSATRR